MRLVCAAKLHSPASRLRRAASGRLLSGDNFVSPAVNAATNITTVLSGLTLGTHYSDVKRFNAITQAWESYQGGAFTQFEPAKGYNIIGLTTCSFSYGKKETTTTFVYDSTGQRVKKTVGATTTTYLGKDYDVTGSTSTKYIFLGDRRISTKDSGGTLQFIHEDHISSSNVVTDSSGNQSGLLEYDPYGSTVTQTGASNPKHKFTGQEEDSSTKLYYYGARYYDPQLGRFITPDTFIQKPEDPQTFNRYAYARNNPIRFTDPTGNFIFAIFAAIGSFIATHATALAVASIALSAASIVARMAGAEKLAKGLSIAAMITGAASIAGGLASAGTPAVAGYTSESTYILVDNVWVETSYSITTHYAAAGIPLSDIASTVAVNSVAAPLAIKPDSPTQRESGRATQAAQVTLTIISRPTDFPKGYHHLLAYEQETGSTIELLRENGKNAIHRSGDRTNANKIYAEKMKGGLNVTVDKSRLDAAFKTLKERYNGKGYNAFDNSNNFIINLLKEAGRPLSDEELLDLDITKHFPGFFGVILSSPIWDVLLPRPKSTTSDYRFLGHGFEGKWVYSQEMKELKKPS